MLKCQKKWLELFLKKFLLCTFRNNVESETVLYLTNGRKNIRAKLKDVGQNPIETVWGIGYKLSLIHISEPTRP